MFCPQCGNPCPDGMRFCERCGAPLTGAAPQPVAAVPLSPVAAAVKKLVSSPLYLVAAIAYTCAILFSFIYSISGGGLMQLVDWYTSMALRSYGLSSNLNAALNGLSSILPYLRSASIGSALLSQLPAIAIAVGIWLMFAAVFDKTGAPMKTVGLTVIKVVCIVQLVLISLGLFLVELMLVIATVSAARYSDEIIPVMVAVIVGAAIGGGLGILYFVKLVSTLGTMQKTMQTQQPSDQVSAYVAVYSILGGCFSVLSLLVAGGFLAVLNILCSAAASFCFAAYLFQYRTRMRELMAGVMPYREPAPQPVYTAPQPAAFEPPPAAPAAPAMNLPETTVLNAPVCQTVFRLIRMRDGSLITVSQPRMRVGRDPSAVDYIINDNTAVGRQHADFLAHDGGFFVKDLRSTNHTFLNGQQLEPEVEYALQPGDEVVLGDEAFRVEG